MTDLAKLVVRMEADNAKMYAELKRAVKEIKSFERVSKKSVSAVGDSFKRLAALFSAGLFIKWIKDANDFGDEIQKLSGTLKDSTAALSQYSYVAKLSGVQFPVLTKAFQDQSRKIAEAAKGYGDGAQALKELGLDAKKLDLLTPTQQFEILADSLNKISNTNNRTALAIKLWSDQGANILRVTDQGSEGIRKMRAEFDRLGGTLTQEAVDKMAATNDAIAKMGIAGKSLANSIAVNIGPYLAEFANWLAENIPQGVQASRIAINQFILTIDKASAAINDLLAARDRIDAAVLPKGSGITGHLLGAIGLGDATEEKALESMKKHMNAANEARLSAVQAQKDLNDAVEKYNKLISDKSAEFIPKPPPKTGGGKDDGLKLLGIYNSPGYDQIDPFAQLTRDREQYIIDTMNFHQTVEDLTKEHNRRLQEQQQTQLGILSGSLASAAQLIAGNSKRAFEAYKAFAYAETIVSTYAAAQAAFYNTMQIPGIGTATAYAAAGAAILSGLARAKAIHDQSLSGGGGASASVGGAGVAASAQTPASSFQPPPSIAQPINIYLGDGLLATVVSKGLKNAVQSDYVVLEDAENFNRINIR